MSNIWQYLNDLVHNHIMDISNLELVADDFESGKHEELDEFIHRNFLVTSPRVAHYILYYVIVEDLGSHCPTKYHNIMECKTLLNNNPPICDMIADGTQNGFKKL